MPSPIILGHVAKGSIDTTLSSNRVRTSREKLRDTSSLESGLGGTHGSTKTCSSSPNHHSIKIMIDNRVFPLKISVS